MKHSVRSFKDYSLMLFDMFALQIESTFVAVQILRAFRIQRRLFIVILMMPHYISLECV